MSCFCGFSKSYPICDSTHSIVKSVKDQIINRIVEYFNQNEKDKINLEDIVSLIKKTKNTRVNP